MQNNILSLIDSQADRIKQKIIEGLNWTWRDTYYCEQSNGLIDLGFFHPTFLFHVDKNKKDGCFIWYRLEIASAHHSEKGLKEVLEQVLNAIGLKPFKDEDAGPHGGKIFVKHRKDIPGYVIAYCYVNPDFPGGRWENHVLPPKE